MLYGYSRFDAGNWVAATDPNVSPVVTIDVSDVGRDADSGDFTYRLSASESFARTPAGVCYSGSGCFLSVEGQFADGSTTTFSSFSIPSDATSAFSHEFAGSIGAAKIIAVRAGLFGSYQHQYSNWTPIEDVTLESSVSIAVGAIGRDQQTGEFTYRLTASESFAKTSTGACFSGSGCTLTVEAQFADGSSTTLNSANVPSGVSSPFSRELTGSAQAARVIAVRAGLYGNYDHAYSDWAPVQDPSVTPAVSITVGSIDRLATGDLVYSVTGSASFPRIQSGACASGSGCTLTAEVQFEDGSLTTLSSANVPPGAASPFSFEFSGNAAANRVVAIRAGLYGNYNHQYSDWVPVQDPRVNATPIGSAAITGATVQRSAADGKAEFDIAASATSSDSDGGVCKYDAGTWNYCYLAVDYKTASGQIGHLDQARGTRTVPQAQEFTGSVVLERIVAVRATVSGNGGTVFGTWAPVTDTGPPASTTDITSAAVSREVDTGKLHYAASVASISYTGPGGVCELRSGTWNYCTVGLEARTQTGDILTLDTARSTGGATTPQSFEGAADIKHVTAIRSTVSGNGGVVRGSWKTVTDDGMQEASSSLSDIEIGRDSKTGNLTYDIPANSKTYLSDSGTCRQRAGTWNYCTLYLQARTQAGDIQTIDSERGTGTAPATHEFAGIADIGKISALRAAVGGNGGYSYGVWVSVSDKGPEQKVSADVKKITASDNSPGTWDFEVDVDARSYKADGGACRASYNCTIALQARLLGGQITDVGSVSANSSTAGNAFTVRGNTGYATLQAIRPVIYGTGRPAFGRWVSASTWVQDGHDVNALITSIDGAIGADSTALLAFCINGFPVGPHTTNSSLNDFQAACTARANSGKSIRLILKEMIEVFGTAPVVRAALRVGGAAIAATAVAVTYGDAMPTGCRNSSGGSITCTDSNGITTSKPIKGTPAPLDKTWEENQLNRSTTAGSYSGDQGENPSPEIISVTDADDAKVLRTRTCVAELNQVIELPDGSTTTRGDQLGLTNEDCVRGKILFPGVDMGEAGLHTADAIASGEHPILLTYIKGGAVGGEHQVPRMPNPPGCENQVPVEQQCDEYPFYSAEEGIESGTVPSYRPVRTADNVTQSIWLRRFYHAKECSSFQSSPRKSADRKYLVVPIIQLNLNTTYACMDD